MILTETVYVGWAEGGGGQEDLMGAYSPYLGVREEHLGGVGFLMTCAVTTACITSGHHKGMPHCQCSDATVTPPLCLRETYESLLCRIWICCRHIFGGEWRSLNRAGEERAL